MMIWLAPCSRGGRRTKREFLDQWRTALTRDLPLPVTDQLPQGWLHAVFHPSNVVFLGDQVRAVLERRALPYFTAAAQARTAARY